MRFEERHIQDSLRLVALVEEAAPGPCIDVGSGAGLPGVPLAIATKRQWRLLEPRHRRAAFLEEVVRTLGLDCEVVVATAEQAAADPRLIRSHSVAVARALAPPEESVRLLVPLVAPTGYVALFVGRKPVPAGTEEWAPGIATMRLANTA